MFLLGLLSACYRWLFQDDQEVFARLMQAIFDAASLSMSIGIGLAGLLCFWMGIMRLAERTGAVERLASLLSPLFSRLMPEVPKGHPAIGGVTMNLAANILGLDNAATPLGIKAMQQLQTLNPLKDTASNAQILFLVLNTSSVTIFPVTVFLYRAQLGAEVPTDVFLPLLLATTASSVAGLLAVAWVQKIKLYDAVLVGYGLALALLMALPMLYLLSLPASDMAAGSGFIANILLVLLICSLMFVAWKKGVDVYEEFVEGAKEGVSQAFKIVPYLVAMLCAISFLRASGALESFMSLVRTFVEYLGLDGRFVDALPTGLMKPFSGSGARALMIETMETHGADSFAGRLSSIMQGSTETTFYVLAVYFGAVGIQRARHAVACGLIADAAGITAAIMVCYWIFG
ncbi:spore maturation protein [Corallincola platygyrae]